MTPDQFRDATRAIEDENGDTCEIDVWTRHGCYHPCVGWSFAVDHLTAGDLTVLHPVKGAPIFIETVEIVALRLAGAA